MVYNLGFDSRLSHEMFMFLAPECRDSEDPSYFSLDDHADLFVELGERFVRNKAE